MSTLLILWLIARLQNKEDKMNNYIWYAVEMNAEDNDWGTGSFDKYEAMKMAKEYGKNAQVAVISGHAKSKYDAETNGLQDTECIEIIPYEDMDLTLKGLRETRNMTQAEAAQKAGINLRMYQTTD